MGRRDRDLGLRRPERVSLRRRDRAVGDDRRPLPVPAHRAAVPARRARGRRVGGRRRHRQRIVGARRDGRTRRRHRGAAGVGRQRRDARERRADPGARRGLVPDRGNAGVAGNDRVHGDGFDGSQRCRRSHHGNAVARGHRSDRRRRAARSHDPRRAARRLEHVHHRRRARHARELRGAGRDRQRSRFRRLRRVRRRRRSRRGRGRRVAVPRGRVVRAVHAVQARRAAHRRAARRDDARRGRGRTTSTSCDRASRRSPTARGVRSRRSNRWSPRACSSSFPPTSPRTSTRRRASAAPIPVAELVDIADGVARIDERHAAKQPDWTYDPVDSGKLPAARLGEHRDPQALA